MPVCFSWLYLHTDSKYVKIEGSFTWYHWAPTPFVNFLRFKTMVFPGRAYLFNDTYLIRTYKIVNRKALEI